MSRGRPIVFAYDISQRKARQRIHRILKAWRLDGQKSVHECRLTEDRAGEIFDDLARSVDPKTDSLFMAWVEPHRKIHYRGVGGPAAPNNLWMVG